MRDFSRRVVAAILTLVAGSACRPPPAASPTPPLPATASEVSFVSAPIKLPALLLYQSAQESVMPGIWLLDGETDSLRVVDISEVGGFEIAPDRKRVLYYNDANIWLLDLPSGSTQNITRSQSPVLFRFHWWPGRDGFATGSGPLGACSGGYPTYVGLDGQFDVLDDKVTLSDDLAVSPDGKTVAYYGTAELDGGCIAKGYSLYLYHVEDDTHEQLDLADYGLPGHRVDGLSWSPDGTKLGLVTNTYEDGANRPQEYIVILDLTHKSSRILRQFEKFTTGSDAGSTPQWAPSGKWLVFQTAELTGSGEFDSALWYADDNDVRRLTPEDRHDTAVCGLPSISPDEQWVAVAGSSEITLVRVQDGMTFLWPMPAPPYQVGWVLP